jgi:formylglycine-generating enzyme required for sulfatase activity
MATDAAAALDWLLLPAGTALIGVDLQSDAADTPVSRVTLTGFAISRTPVTNAQYAHFTAATGRRAPAHWEGPQPPAALADHPVTYVDWHAARAYCAWAGGRLPTEAEWEYAARGTAGRRYPWGAAAPTALLCNFAGQIGATTPVGRYPAGASPFGLLDTAGNVWEWTATLLRPYPYRTDDGREDAAAAGARVVRGGSYQHDAAEVSCIARDGLYPDACDVYIGFRVVTDDLSRAAPLDWVPIPAGDCHIGAAGRADAAGEAQPGRGTPLHRVSLAAFALTRTPVTNAQYAVYTTATAARPPAHWEGLQPPAALADHPVTYVDWFEAAAFCAWAGGRLPTEAEWEYAARDADARPYPWGDKAPDAPAAWFAQSATRQVDGWSAGAGPFGHCELAGNVWEWTASLFRPYPYRTDDGREDATAAGQRVLRGGSWRSAHGGYLHAAFRSLSYPARRRDHIGFRVARTLPHCCSRDTEGVTDAGR